MKYKIAWPIVVLIGVLLSQTAWAGISLSPMIFEITQPPGSSYSGVLFVTNTGDKDIVVEARVLGFTAPQGIPQFLETEMDLYAYSGHYIVTVEPQEKKVQAGETALFHYRSNMPKVLKPYGGRYASVVFRKKLASSKGQVRVATQVASLFLLNPGGEVSSHLTIDKTQIHQSEENPRTVILEATVTNNGNIHASQDQIASLVNVLDEDGYIVDQFHLDSHTMLPGNTSVFREQWKIPNNLPSGSYQFYLTIMSFGSLGTEPQPFSIMQTVKLKF